MKTSRFGAQTVSGWVSAEALGTTLVHEHLAFDFTACQVNPMNIEEASYAHRAISMEMLGYLRFHPLHVRDNLVNDDEALLVEELADLTAANGHTIVDPTNESIGRDPRALLRIAQKTGLNIVMGSGFYIEPALGAHFSLLSTDDITRRIIDDITIGVDGTAIRAGVIGEVGTSSPITEMEEKSLRGAARAQFETGAPLMVHLDGWAREGHRALDIVADEGADLQRTILCHMNPSWADEPYQASLAERGAYIAFDMLGNNHVYPHPEGASPDELAAIKAIAQHLRHGRGTRVLLSQDVYLKMMFKRYGGYGYGHILTNLTSLFDAAGIGAGDLELMLAHNPARVLSFLQSPPTKESARE